MNVYELAKKYYKKGWDILRLKTLVEAGKLTEEQYNEITGTEYAEETGDKVG